MSLFPDDELENLEGSSHKDDLFPDGDSIFAVPLVRMEGLADEMTEGMLINPQFIPTMLDRIDLEGVAPIIVTEVADQGYLVSIDLTDFILNSNPVVPATPDAGDCSTLIASTEFVCQAIVDSCKVLGPDPEDENKFLFEDCNSNPFTITVYPNPTLVEGPDNVFTWTDPGTGDSVVLDLRPNTFNIEANGTHTWTNPVTGQVHSINAGNLGIDPVGLSHITATNVRSAISELNDLVITMVPDTEGALVLANATESFKVLLSCEGQRVTDIVPAGSKVIICTPNDGSYITDIDNILPTSDEIDCSLIANTDIVPADTKVLICTPNDGVKQTDLQALLSDCNFEVEEGEGIDVDVQDGTGLCGGTKHYKISVDLCEFTIIDAAEVSTAVAPYFAMCVDGANFKISLVELQLLIDAVGGGEGNFWTQGQGTSLVGLGTVGSPYSVDLALQAYIPIPYEETASIAQISFGNNGIMPAIKAGTNIIIDPDGTLHSSAVLSSVSWGNIVGDIAAQADLESAFVNRAGSSMSGDLALDNAALILRADGAVDVGIIKAVETAVGEQLELQIIGSSDGVVSDLGLKLNGDYIDLAATTVSLGIPGAEVGSRVIATGINTDGSAQLGFEPAPKPTYTENCINATDFPIGSGTGPQAWVEVCNIVTSEDITDEVVVVAYFQIYVVNNSNAAGKVEISSHVDAASPAIIHSYEIPAKFAGTISDTLTSFGNTTSGQTIFFVVRSNGDTPNFDLNAVGTIQAAGTKFVVLGASASGVTNFLELLDTPIDYTGHALEKIIVNAGETGVEFVPDAGGGCPGLEPYLASIDSVDMPILTTKDFTVVGGNFDEATTVEFSGNTAPVVNSITVLNDHTMVINVTSDATIGIANLVVKNCESTSFGEALSIDVLGFESSFIFTWESTAGQSLTLPLVNGYNYNFNVDWGDGSSDTITSYNQAERIHSYVGAAVNTVTISGTCEAFSFNGSGSYLTMRTLENLGAVGWVYLQGAFKSCYNMTKLHVGDCDTTNVTTFREFMRDVYATDINISSLDMESCTTVLAMLQSTKMLSLDLSGWDVSNIQSFDSFLYANTAITSLNITGWVTSSATSFNGTFRSANKLTTIDVSTFDMSNVINIIYMFYGCSLLNTLDTSNWYLPVCTTLNNAFLGTSALTTLELGSWGISSACINLREAFSSCGLQSADVLSWDVSNVGSLYKTFYNCDGLVNFDASNWNVTSVTLFNDMLGACSALVSINLTNWNLSVTNNTTTGMFGNCTALVNINLAGWTVRKITNASSMFTNLDSLITFDISGWDLSNCLSVSTFVNGCANLESINISNVIFGNVTFSSTFYNNPSLEVFNADNAYVDNVTNLSSLMSGNSSLTLFKTLNWNTVSNTDLGNAFIQCSSLVSLDLSHWNVSLVDDLTAAFQLCSSLVSLNTTGWDTANVVKMSSIFRDSVLLIDVDISHWDISSINSTASQSMSLMFFNVTWNTVRYDAALAAWSGLLTPPSTVTFHAGQLTQYTDAASRLVLTGTHGWLITDNGAV